jgi:hypothetical protein
MKRILIIGDSWAIVPCNLWAHQDRAKHQDYIRKSVDILDWLDFRLLSLGHSVSNMSYGGNINSEQIQVARTFLDSAKKHNFNIDVVIWFHTELMRGDFHMYQKAYENNEQLQLLKNQGWNALLDKLSTDLYTDVKNLHLEHPNTKWVIIGGHAPIRENTSHLLSWADLLIKDLRKEILNTDIPECHSLSFRSQDWEYLREHVDLSVELILDELNNKQFIYDICKDQSKFYDEIHPSPKSNYALSQQIIDFFQLA